MKRPRLNEIFVRIADILFLAQLAISEVKMAACLSSFSFLVIVRNGFIILPPTSALTNSMEREANESSGESLNLSRLNESLPTLPELTFFLNRSLTGVS